VAYKRAGQVRGTSITITTYLDMIYIYIIRVYTVFGVCRCLTARSDRTDILGVSTYHCRVVSSADIILLYKDDGDTCGYIAPTTNIGSHVLIHKFKLRGFMLKISRIVMLPTIILLFPRKRGK